MEFQMAVTLPKNVTEAWIALNQSACLLATVLTGVEQGNRKELFNEFAKCVLTHEKELRKQMEN